MRDLIDRLCSEDTQWSTGDPLYMNLRKEAAARIKELEELVKQYEADTYRRIHSTVDGEVNG